ncbi:Ger(x)C family spore germination protein [Bacillus paranthracis]
MMQTKMSREIFRGHQRVILIGEKMAKNGLASVLDAYSRDPDIRLRADAFVIKGHTAKEF